MTATTPYVGSTPLPWMRSVSNWLRWGALALSLMLVAAGDEPPVPTSQVVVAGATLVAFALTRTVPWIGSRSTIRAVLATEPVVAVLAVALSGGWSSPFTVYLAVPVLFLAMAAGLRSLALVAGIAAVLTVHELTDGDALVLAEVGATLGPMVIAATVGLVARRAVRQAEDTQSAALGRLQELSHVNALLSTLHDLVRTTPAPLTIDAVMASVSDELDELFEPDTVTLLLADGGGRFWRSVHTRGGAARAELAASELPSALLERERVGHAIQVDRLGPDGGIDQDAVSGTYLWLWSRGVTTGLLAIEHRREHQLDARRIDTLDRLAAPLGLAVDNAVWFQRLRTLGAEEERQRLGAALHDQFAQSLVYVAMELDRVAARHPDDDALDALRGEVRNTLADLRETLRELRLRCTEERGLVPTLREHLEHLADRAGVSTRLEAGPGVPRAPLPIENQLLRIAQDLLVLSHRESSATRIVVSFQAEAGRLRMVVSDDGRGRPETELGHQAVELLTGVRDRADAIGALVDVLARPGEGTETAVTIRGLY